jgi:hypothetical protein
VFAFHDKTHTLLLWDFTFTLVGLAGGTVSVDVNAAVAVILPVMGMVHIEVIPVHTPPHSAKEDPNAGAAVRVTEVSGGNDAVHVGLHVIPAGVLVTVPVPVAVTANV